MPSAEEDHDHDLPRRIGRCRRHHHRWIFRTVNAKTRYVPGRMTLDILLYRECPDDDKNVPHVNSRFIDV